MYFTMRGNDKDERPRDYGGSVRTSEKHKQLLQYEMKVALFMENCGSLEGNL